MPTKKTSNKESESPFDFQKLMQNSDSYKSLIYGIVTVVVLFIVIALGVRTLQQNKAQIDEEAISTQSEESKKGQYTVVEGDTLWSIAEKNYNDGFAWEEIAKANNISDASILEKGTKLIIPNIDKNLVMEAAEPTVIPTIVVSPTLVPEPNTAQKVEIINTEMSGQKISSNNYAIVEADTLWDIAVRAYGDGYRWGELATANNIDNPNLIYVGDTLKIPRP